MFLNLQLQHGRSSCRRVSLILITCSSVWNRKSLSTPAFKLIVIPHTMPRILKKHISAPVRVRFSYLTCELSIFIPLHSRGGAHSPCTAPASLSSGVWFTHVASVHVDFSTVFTPQLPAIRRNEKEKNNTSDTKVLFLAEEVFYFVHRFHHLTVKLQFGSFQLWCDHTRARQVRLSGSASVVSVCRE